MLIASGLEHPVSLHPFLTQLPDFLLCLPPNKGKHFSSVSDPDPGFGIRCLFYPGSGIRNRYFPDPGSLIPNLYFWELVAFKGPKKSPAPRTVSILCKGTI
jgi:hypothetical protein